MGGTTRMRKGVTIAALCVLGWAQAGSAVIAGETFTPSAAFAAGTAAFSEGDFALALAHFEAALSAGLDGPAIHYNIGVCRYKLGRYAESGAAFALIAERYPDMRGLAEYNLGLVALKQGDAARAMRHFRTALASTNDETIVSLARSQLELETKAAGSRPAPAPLVLVDARLGYDDNVLLLADEIPLPDGQSGESRFIELWALLSRPVGEFGVRVDGSAYVLRYPEASMFDQDMVRIEVPYEWTSGGWRVEAGPQLAWTTLDGGLLDRRLGVAARVSRDIGQRSALELRYARDEIHEGDSRYAFFAGDRRILEARLERRGALGRLTLSHAVERNDRDAATVSPRRSRWAARYRRDLGPNWLVDIEISRRRSRYDDLIEPRIEELAEVGLSATRALGDDWLLNAEVELEDNDSKVETVAYRRKRISFGVTKQFR